MNADTKPIKICFVAPKAYPLFNPNVKEVIGGAEVDLYLLAMELAKDENFAVSFITADYGQEKIQTIENIRVIKSVDFNKNPLSGAIRVWRAMREADAQMYMIKSISQGMFLTAFFCHVHRKAFLYRTSNNRHCDGTYFKQRPLLRRVFKWVLSTAKLVLVQNISDKDNLERAFGIVSTVIPNGHRIAELAKVNHDTILWVGRNGQFKRPELFINLAEKVPDEKFTMVCQRATGDERYEQLVAKAKQVKNLEFIERVPFDEIESYFQRAKVFVNTSDSEGFPNTFIQACKCGTPILSLKVNPDGFLDKYECGICCSGNFGKLVDSLAFMLAEKRYLQLGRNARKYVEEHHDIAIIVEQYKKLFVQLAQGRGKDV